MNRSPLRTPSPLALALAVSLAAIASNVTAATATQAADRISPHLADQAKSGAPVDVLIRLDGSPMLDLVDPARSKSDRGAVVAAMLQAVHADARAPVVAWLEARGVAWRSLWIANAVTARIEPALLDELAGLPSVAAVHSDRAFQQAVPDTVPTTRVPKAVEANVSRINAPQAWAAGFRGQGVVVGVQDTGYQWDHPALRARYRGWDGSTATHAYNWHDAIHALLSGGSNPCGVDSPVPCDDNGHGTHTLGTVLGDDGLGNQVGVAPDAQWMACRNMERGNGRPSSYLECFQFFLAPTDAAGQNPDPAKAPDIISNSWGCPVGPPPGGEDCVLTSFDDALVALRTAGILVVVAAGNGTASCGSIADPPAISAQVFTVGATNNSDAIASFSLIGPVSVDGSNRIKPDVVAPGVSVRSSTRNGGYGFSSGTSMATPAVAGAAALVLSAAPSLRGQPAEIERILRETAVPLTGGTSCGAFSSTAWPNIRFGHGRIDAFAAAQAATARLFDDGFEP
jgi:subtilisin family serine protease